MDYRATLTLEAGTAPERLLEKLSFFAADPRLQLIVLCEQEPGSSFRSSLAGYADCAVHNIGSFLAEDLAQRLVPLIKAETVAFLAAEAPPLMPPWQRIGPREAMVLIAEQGISPHNFKEHEWFCRSWLAHRSLLEKPLQVGRSYRWDLLSILAANKKDYPRVLAAPAYLPPPSPSASSTAEPVLHQHSRILAMIPHFRCEAWLGQAVSSLTQQTRPPDRIVVIDDHSPQPPLKVLAEYGQVTLLRGRQNSGPYALINQVISQTDFDGYLMQDADDWSALDRLELQLAAAADTAAELIGGQQLQILDPQELDEPQRAMVPEGLILPTAFPLDVNQALNQTNAHALSHGTCLFSRSLWQRLGGFATGFRFGGDTEFLWRAYHRARVVNIPYYYYFRRIRRDSLFQHPETGARSQARLEQQLLLRNRYFQNQNAAEPDLRPLKLNPPLQLEHLQGPPLW